MMWLEALRRTSPKILSKEKQRIMNIIQDFLIREPRDISFSEFYFTVFRMDFGQIKILEEFLGFWHARFFANLGRIENYFISYDNLKILVDYDKDETINVWTSHGYNSGMIVYNILSPYKNIIYSGNPSDIIYTHRRHISYSQAPFLKKLDYLAIKESDNLYTKGLYYDGEDEVLFFRLKKKELIELLKVYKKFQ